MWKIYAIPEMFSEYKLFFCTQIIIITSIIWGVFTLISIIRSYVCIASLYTKFSNCSTDQMNFTYFNFIVQMKTAGFFMLYQWNCLEYLMKTFCQFTIKFTSLLSIQVCRFFLLDEKFDLSSQNRSAILMILAN